MNQAVNVPQGVGFQTKKKYARCLQQKVPTDERLNYKYDAGRTHRARKMLLANDRQGFLGNKSSSGFSYIWLYFRHSDLVFTDFLIFSLLRSDANT